MAETMLGFDAPEEQQIEDLIYLPNWLDSQQAWEVFDLMETELPWQQGELNMFGKKVKTPRLECFLADKNIHYTYSGQQMPRTDWPKFIHPILSRLKEEYDVAFNACLCNLYRTGEDKVGWHADDEPELGKTPFIASLSFGANRTFQIKHNQSHLKKNLLLEHASLIIMKNNFQSDWKHQIPAEKSVLTPRINLTFRFINNKI